MVSAETVNTFKNRLDKFWSDQEVLYDNKAYLHGIRNRRIAVWLSCVLIMQYFKSISRM